MASALPAGLANLADPDAFLAGVPHETFRRLRAEAPVVFHPERDGPGFWVVSRWRDVRAVSLDQQTFSSQRGGIILRDLPSEQLEAQRETLTAMEPGRHGKYRRLVSGAFTPRVIRALEPRLRALVTGVLDRIAARGSCDFVAHVAAELPVIAICELLGVPPEDYGNIMAWSNALIGMDDTEYAGDPQASFAAAMQIGAYAHDLAEARRAAPRADLVSELLEAEVDGARLTAAEFNAFVMVLAVAGNETTRNLISGGFRALCEFPEERDRLARNPDLLPSAVEEMLRFVTPVMHFRRTATRDVELAGVRIREGDKVTIWYVSANRDETVFDAPDRFDAGRAANDHLAFGFGPHFCLGAALAQLEARLLFEQLLSRFPDMTLAGPVARLRSNHINGIKRMPVRYTPEPRRTHA